LDEAERAAIPPRDGDGFVDETGREDDREVGASVEAHRDLAFVDGDIGRHVDEVTEDLARLSVIVPEAACCLSGRHFFQEVGPQSLILALTRGRGLLEEALAIR